MNSIFGIDLSHYDSKSFHFNLLEAHHVRFVYVKATQGTSYKDGNFQVYWANLAKLDHNKVSRGAYHFLSAGIRGDKQADAFVDYVNLHGGFKSDDLAPVVDLEWDITSRSSVDAWTRYGTADNFPTVLACLQRIKERTNRTPVIYTARSWLSDRTITPSEFSKLKDYPVWIADYSNKRKLSEKPALPQGVTQCLWQFTDRATFAVGGEQPVDASVYYGSLPMNL